MPTSPAKFMYALKLRDEGVSMRETGRMVYGHVGGGSVQRAAERGRVWKAQVELVNRNAPPGVFHVPLTKRGGFCDEYAVVDEADREWVMEHAWHVRDGYALTRLPRNGTRMHVEVVRRQGIRIPPGWEVHHGPDTSPLNNRRANLEPLPPHVHRRKRGENNRFGVGGVSEAPSGLRFQFAGPNDPEMIAAWAVVRPQLIAVADRIRAAA